MSRDKQTEIEEMALEIDSARSEALRYCHSIDCEECKYKHCTSSIVAEALYDKNYRKVDEDYARQCTCYTLGCQMAEQLERKVAEEIFVKIEKQLQEKIMAISTFRVAEDEFYDGEIHALGVFGVYLAELKKKYTKSEKDNGN